MGTLARHVTEISENWTGKSPSYRPNRVLKQSLGFALFARGGLSSHGPCFGAGTFENCCVGFRVGFLGDPEVWYEPSGVASVELVWPLTT